MDGLEGKRLQGYEIQDLIGRGAMGAVYRAYQPHLKRYVALKILTASQTEDETARRRFLREAQALATLEHPHIIPLHDFGSTDEMTFVVMRLLEGGTLAAHLQQRGVLPLAEWNALVQPLAEALAYAHTQGIIHRDLKPANIMFDHHSQPYLTDFGLVKFLDGERSQLTHPATVLGTPIYMAPEQWQRGELTAATDQYALAVMCFEVLTGKHPFNTTSIATLMNAHIHEKPPAIHETNTTLPKILSLILQKGMAKRPLDRFESVRAFAAAIDAVTRGETPLIEIPNADTPLPTTDYVDIDGPTSLLGQLPKVVYRLPAPAPYPFHGRQTETAQLNAFVQSPLRAVTLIGRGGVGKTGLVCRFFKSLETGRLPDQNGQINLQGIVYLSWQQRTLNEPALYEGLCRLLPDEAADNLRALARDPHITIEVAYTRLLDQFRGGGVLILMDNIEEILDKTTPLHPLMDLSLNSALETILGAAPHPVKLIMTSRIRPSALLQTQPSRHLLLDLHEGLPHPYAEQYLKAMDEMGDLGLSQRADDDPLLRMTQERTRGNPRALEAIIGILRTDDNATLENLLSPLPSPSPWHGEERGKAVFSAQSDHFELPSLLPDDVTTALVAEAFQRLDIPAQTVMQALAIYNHAVPLAAITHLLTAILDPTDVPAILRRLINMRFVQRQMETFALHPIDSAYALSRISTDPATPFNRRDLWRRGADYYYSIRKPQPEWKMLEDLAPQLAEIELRLAAGDGDTAAAVLMAIGFDYLFVWGYVTLVRDNLLKIIPHIQEVGTQGRCLTLVGIAHHVMGQTEAALGFYERALGIAQAAEEPMSQSSALNNLGNAHLDLGDIEKALTYYQQALAVAQDMHDERGEGNHLGNIGNAYLQLGRFAAAIEVSQQAYEIALRLNDQRRAAIWLGNVGVARANGGDLARAITNLQEALSIATDIHYLRQQCRVNIDLAEVYLMAGMYAKAETMAAVACTLDVPEYNHWAWAMHGLTRLLMKQPAAAMPLFDQCITMATALLEKTPRYYEAWYARGLAHAALNHPTEAQSDYERAMALCAAGGILHNHWRRLGWVIAATEDGPLRFMWERLQPKLNP